MTIKNLKKSLKAALVGLGLPMVVTAALGVDSLLARVLKYLNMIITIVFILLTLYFVWGVVGYVRSGGDEKKVADAKRHMLWGIIGLVVAGGAWGIARIFWLSLDITPGEIIDVPKFGF